MISKFTTVVTE